MIQHPSVLDKTELAQTLPKTQEQEDGLDKDNPCEFVRICICMYIYVYECKRREG